MHVFRLGGGCGIMGGGGVEGLDDGADGEVDVVDDDVVDDEVDGLSLIDASDGITRLRMATDRICLINCCIDKWSSISPIPRLQCDDEG